MNGVMSSKLGSSKGAKPSSLDEYAESEMVQRFAEKYAESAVHIGMRKGDLAEAVKLFKMNLERHIPREVLERTLLRAVPTSEESDTPKGPEPPLKRQKDGPSGIPVVEAISIKRSVSSTTRLLKEPTK